MPQFEFAERSQEMVEVEVMKAAPEGLGFGEGSISFKDRKEEVGAEALQRAEAVITSNAILTEVSLDKSNIPVDDDGCGDGRNVSRIFAGEQQLNKSLNRSKVFGGGSTMAVASLIGLGRTDGRTLRDMFSAGISLLRDKEIDFGAHTDTHAHGENCGCGAIDKSPRIIENVINFKDSISASITALGVDTEGLDEVFAAYESFASSVKGQEYQGADVMTEIIENGKIVKELDDNHKEMYVVLNTVEGYTVDQEKVREATDGAAQTFAVDVWRVQQLAERMFANEPEQVCHQAFLGELVYTLATAGTLTKGDLPVFVVSKQAVAVS